MKEETRGRKKIYKTEHQRVKAKKKQHLDYVLKTYFNLTVRFHKEIDKQVIDQIKKQDNRANYIRQLILKDIGGSNNEENN